ERAIINPDVGRTRRRGKPGGKAMTHGRRGRMFLAGVAVRGALVAATAANAQDFAGKRITMIVPYQEGSGSTIHGRLFAMALEKTLPANPTIVIRNID